MEKNNIFEYINNLFLGKTTTSEKKDSDPWELILENEPSYSNNNEEYEDVELDSCSISHY